MVLLSRIVFYFLFTMLLGYLAAMMGSYLHKCFIEYQQRDQHHEFLIELDTKMGTTFISKA